MYNKSKPVFVEFAKARIKDKRNLVISKKSDGEFILAQQVIFKEDGNEIPMFLKGAITIETLDGLYNLRDALNEAIALEENKNSLK